MKGTAVDDLLTAVALIGLIVLALKAANFDLTGYGTAVLAIFGGHAARSYGNGKESDNG